MIFRRSKGGCIDIRNQFGYESINYPGEILMSQNVVRLTLKIFLLNANKLRQK